MESMISVYKQEHDYYVFLDLLPCEGIECPAHSNPSGFNYTKAELIYSVSLYESGLCIDEFDKSIIDSIFNDNAFDDLHAQMAMELISNAANSKSIHDFINEIRHNVEGISKYDHLFN